MIRLRPRGPSGTLVNPTINGANFTGTVTMTGATVALGTPASGVLANCTGLPISTGLSGRTCYVLAATVTASGASAATLTTITDGTTSWSIPLAAATKYVGRVVLRYTCVSTVGYQLSLAASGGLTTSRWLAVIDDSQDAFTNTSKLQTQGALPTTYTGATAGAGQVNGEVIVDFDIVTTVAGNLDIKFASGLDSNTATISRGHIWIEQANN